MDAPDSVELQLTPNEASDLAAIPAAVVPDGYDAAYVTVLDEGVAERSIAVLAHGDGDDVHEGWKAIKLKLTPAATRTARRTPRPRPSATTSSTSPGRTTAPRTGRSSPSAPGWRG
jgi:hypothetical protein